jgi:hypothetical protein
MVAEGAIMKSRLSLYTLSGKRIVIGWYSEETVYNGAAGEIHSWCRNSQAKGQRGIMACMCAIIPLFYLDNILLILKKGG